MFVCGKGEGKGWLWLAVWVVGPGGWWVGVYGVCVSLEEEGADVRRAQEDSLMDTGRHAPDVLLLLTTLLLTTYQLPACQPPLSCCVL